MTVLPFLIIASLLPSNVNAFSAFRPNCTLPSTTYNYVGSPQVRGTMSIVWSCFAVLLLCTWSVQHLAVPLQEKPRRRSHRRRLAISWFRVLAKLFHLEPKERLWNEFIDEVRWNFNRLQWMGLCLIAPEFVLGKALQENLAANDSRKAVGNDEEWTTMHAFFANMRGIVMRFETTAVKKPLEFAKSEKEHRDLNKPRPGNYPTPYFEQDPRQAEEIERRHCREICGNDCTYQKIPQKGVNAAKQNYREAPPLSTVQATTTEPRPRSESEHLNTDPEQNSVLSSFDFTSMQRQAIGKKSSGPASTAPLNNDPQITQQSMCDESLGSPMLLTNSPLTAHRDSSSLSSPGATTSTSLVEASSHSSLHNPNRPTSPPPLDPPLLLPHKTWQGSWPLSSIQIHWAYNAKLIPPPPYLSSEDLKNQSKSDALVKGLTIWQILWLVIQILARSFQSPPLDTTLLEITVCAFAACAILTYIFLWHKPQDIKVPTCIHALRMITREDVIALAARAPLSTMFTNEFWLHGVAVRGMGDNVFPFTRGLKVPSRLTSSFSRKNTSFKDSFSHHHPPSTAKPFTQEAPPPLSHEKEESAIYLSPVLVGIGLSGALFGAIHWAAWSFHFPSPTERLLWRISCGVLLGFPILMTAIYSGYSHYSRGQRTVSSRANEVLRRFGHVCVPLYLLARVYLLVEVFRSLAYSERSVFAEVNWPSAFPHYS